MFLNKTRMHIQNLYEAKLRPHSYSSHHSRQLKQHSFNVYSNLLLRVTIEGKSKSHLPSIILASLQLTNTNVLPTTYNLITLFISIATP